MNNPHFFLTRQTANLMEDFDREIRRGGALYVLHGEAGVGKSRLLRELEANRLADLAHRFVDLADGADPDDAGDVDGQPPPRRIGSLFEDAAPGELIIADHFERASRKRRHQLLQGWATDGLDKRLNLVVAVDSDGLDDFRQLARQFQLEVGSYRLEPLNPAETEAFAGFYLFPERPVGALRMPAAVRRQLRRSRGLVGAVRAILDRDGAAIENAPAGEGGRAAALRLAGVLLILALAAVLAWYSLEQGDFAAWLAATIGGER